jgi:surfeit locus 1 family protein
MARERRRVSVLGLVFVALGVAILVSLGVWQLQRRVWKETLLARIEALKDSPPEPLNVVFNRVRDGGELDFVRVAARCEGLGEGAAHLFAMRPDGSPGWRQIGACRLSGSPYGAILVDLGFETLPAAPGAIPEPAAQPVTLPAGVAVTGVLRAPEPKAWWSGLVSRTSAAQGAGGTDGARFLARDIPAMAVALGAARPAPVMLSLETPLAGPTLQPAPLPTDIPNRHLEYALTWFGLAAALVVFTLVRLFARRGPGRA